MGHSSSVIVPEKVCLLWVANIVGGGKKSGGKKTCQ